MVPAAIEVFRPIMTDFTRARAHMVDSQLRPNKVNDPAVLEAFQSVAREEFVPEAARALSYADEDVPLGDGRYLMEPMVLARLVQAAAIGVSDKILVVGCASGYTAAIADRLGGAVVALESSATFAGLARIALVGEADVAVVEGPLHGGWPEGAPYDVILLGGSVPRIPQGLIAQLDEGGRLAGIVLSDRGLGEAILIERIGEAVSRRVLFDAAVPLLPDFAPAPAFSF
jgi:protein-L-isoaspartate(D-aspartate) O-methyltransferase